MRTRLTRFAIHTICAILFVALIAWAQQPVSVINTAVPVSATSSLNTSGNPLFVSAAVSNSVAVTGTFFQTTQPVSCTAANCLFNLTQWATTTLGTPTNFGTTPGAVIAGSVNASLFSGTTALGTPNTFGTTAPTGNALGVNSATFIGTTLAINDGTAGAQAIGGHFANNATASGTNALPILEGIAQTSYANGTAYTQGRDASPDIMSDGALHVSELPAMRPASFTASKNFAATSTTDNAVLPGNATNTVLVTKVMVSCTQTTAGIVRLTIIKRSAADTSGTSAAMTAVPDDSNYSAAVSAPLSYTGTGPSQGAAVGDVDDYYLGCLAPATATPSDIYILNLWQKPIVLRGVAQQLAVTLNDAAGPVANGTINVVFKWIETATITP